MKILKRKRRVVSVALTLFFTIMALKVQSGILCEFSVRMKNAQTGRFEKVNSTKAQFNMNIKDGATEVTPSGGGQAMTGYRVASDSSGSLGRYQLSAVINGHEFTQNNLRDIQGDEGEDGNWGDQAAVFVGIPIIQYEEHLYLLPIFNLNSAGSGSSSNEPGISMMAYHTEHREHQWVEVNFMLFGTGFEYLEIPGSGDRDSYIDLYVTNGRGGVSLPVLPLANWALRAMGREPSSAMSASRGNLPPSAGFASSFSRLFLAPEIQVLFPNEVPSPQTPDESLNPRSTAVICDPQAGSLQTL